MTQITFEISGPIADETSKYFAEFLKSIDAKAIVSGPVARPMSGGAPAKVIDPIALAALIVSIPSAILAVMDLVDRIEKRRRAQNLVDEAKRLRAEEKTEVRVSVAQAPLALADLTADDLLDMVEKSKKLD